MKIKTITIHSSDNPGSSLQTFALQYFLKENGYDVEIIDYRPKYIENSGSKFKSILKKIFFSKSYRLRLANNEDFFKEYYQLTSKKYTTYKELVQNPPYADVYITGSDQLWNYSFACGKDLAYYLQFVKSGKKLAYAISLGKQQTTENQLDWIYQNSKTFDFISVREASSVSLLDKKGLNNIKHVCDPVLLLDKSIYLKMQIRPKYKNYLVVYLAEKSSLLDELIQELKRKYNYIVIQMGGLYNRFDCDIRVDRVSPSEFLGYLANAQYIVSSSFHATTFAHIFEKNFAVIPPHSNETRIEDILNKTGLKNRIVKNKEDIQNVLHSIEFSEINKPLNKFINYSKQTLIQELNFIERENIR